MTKTFASPVFLFHVKASTRQEDDLSPQSHVWERIICHYSFLCLTKQHFSTIVLIPDLYVNCTVLCWPGRSLPERGEMEKSLWSWIFIRWSSDGLKSPDSAQYSSSICWSSGSKNDLRETILIISSYCVILFATIKHRQIKLWMLTTLQEYFLGS